MKTHADKKNESECRAAVNKTTTEKNNSKPTFQFADNRPEAISQRKLKEAINNSPQVQQQNAHKEEAEKSTQLMKRSTRTIGLSDMDSTTSSEKKVYTSGTVTREVSIGKLREFLKMENEADRRYNILETLLEDIGKQSKGHDIITGNSDLMNIYKAVCSDLSITVKWTGLNT